MSDQLQQRIMHCSKDCGHDHDTHALLGDGDCLASGCGCKGCECPACEQVHRRGAKRVEAARQAQARKNGGWGLWG